MMSDFDLLGRIVSDRPDKQFTGVTIKPIDSVPIIINMAWPFPSPLFFHSDHRSDFAYKNPVKKTG